MIEFLYMVGQTHFWHSYGAGCCCGNLGSWFRDTGRPRRDVATDFGDFLCMRGRLDKQDDHSLPRSRGLVTDPALGFSPSDPPRNRAAIFRGII